MGVSIESMSWDNCWFKASDERQVLKAFAKKFKGSYLNEGRFASTEELAEKGPLYGISIDRTTDGRILVGEEAGSREKLGALDECVERLAPFMADGGTIEVATYEAMWKWVFRHGKVEEYPGRVVYRDELPDGYVQDEMWCRWFLPGREPPDEVWFEVDR